MGYGRDCFAILPCILVSPLVLQLSSARSGRAEFGVNFVVEAIASHGCSMGRSGICSSPGHFSVLRLRLTRVPRASIVASLYEGAGV